MKYVIFVWIICVGIFCAIAEEEQGQKKYGGGKYDTIEDMDRAILASIDERLRINPKDAEAHSNRGYILRCAGRYEEAIASFDLAIKYKFKYLTATYYEKGVALQALERYEEALEAYNKAMELGLSEDKHVNHSRNEVLLILGRLGKK